MKTRKPEKLYTVKLSIKELYAAWKACADFVDSPYYKKGLATSRLKHKFFNILHREKRVIDLNKKYRIIK